MRLLGLLIVLGLGLWMSAGLWGNDAAPQRLGLTQEATEPVISAPSQPAVLPATVARLLRDADTEATEVVARSDQRGPVVLPVPANLARLPVEPREAASQAFAGNDALEGPVKRVNATSANVRGGASTQTAVVGRLVRGDEVLVLETKSGWARIVVEGDGISGWISTKLLDD